MVSGHQEWTHHDLSKLGILELEELHVLGFGLGSLELEAITGIMLCEFLDSLSFLWVVKFLVRKHELC
jgi:hypothetical protein